MPKNSIRVRKSDYTRVLITETLPYETPIIFSNDGFHSHAKNIGKGIYQNILDGFIFGNLITKPQNSTIPFQYKIRKSATSLRRLSLLHPVSQWYMRLFYEKYEKLILHYCSVSPASIRSPLKTASAFYSKTSWDNLHEYKKGGVSENNTDRYTKHSPSFFSYNGYNRLYKFFESKDFISLEKKYSVFWSLDVTQCFDSIYTHCLSWAVKDKQFTKKYVSIDSTFAQEFDALIRHANHNETNGIPIGPEISRIFAEIIFQSIEKRVIDKLKRQKNLEFEVDYSLRRYVDDIFIFAKSELDAMQINEFYSNELMTFNLHLNTSKLIKLSRPFSTKKSRISHDASTLLNNFIEKFTDETEERILIPKKINRPWKLTKYFIDAVKSLVSENEATYDDISSFLISALGERIKSFTLIDLAILDHDKEAYYRDSFFMILEILYFLYSVSPSVNASYKLSTSLILTVRFFEKNIPKYEEPIRQKIYELTESLLLTELTSNTSVIDGFISLEAINVLLASRELGEKYLMPESVLLNVFISNKPCNYHDIVSCLFYIKDHHQYRNLRKKIVKIADNMLHDMSDIFHTAEKTYLFLDLISCPYIHRPQKKIWLNKLYVDAIRPLGSISIPTKSEIIEYLDNDAKKEWFINWSEIDLLNSLEKKELNAAY